MTSTDRCAVHRAVIGPERTLGSVARARHSGRCRHCRYRPRRDVMLAPCAMACRPRVACSISHPCTPTFCSVFDHNPCVPEVQYPIGQDLRLTVESGLSFAIQDAGSRPQYNRRPVLPRCVPAGSRRTWQPPGEGAQMSIRFQFQSQRQPDRAAAPHLRHEGYASRCPAGLSRQHRRGLSRCAPLHFTQRPRRRDCRPADRHSLCRKSAQRKDKKRHDNRYRKHTIILDTTQGPVTIEMRPDLAPNSRFPHQGTGA